MKRYPLFALLVVGSFLTDSLESAELRILPPTIVLDGPRAAQRVRVVLLEDDVVVDDVTNTCRLIVGNAKMVRVNGDTLGVLADGATMLTAEHRGQKASASVKVSNAKQPSNPSFRNHVLPILTRLGCNSGACHGALAGKGGLKLSLRGYDPLSDHFVLTRQALGRRIDRNHPEKSLLLLKPTTALPHGGGRKIEVDSPEFQILGDWIASGAPAPSPDDTAIQRIEVFPKAARMKPGDSLQMLVRAWYSDGSSLDVTRWAKFNSSEELVARVDEQGQVNVAGHGEAAVTVWYSNFVAANRVTSPLPKEVPAEVYAKSANYNLVDQLVLDKLQSLNIPPSPICSDEVFIRRIYLDAAGILPTPSEVQTFLADPSANKREKLVDAILKRPEFVDYWTHKWSDLLLISTRRLPQPAVWSFFRFVRRHVAENTPWDKFARSILTANGSNLQNGGTNYFVLHKDVAELSEATSVTFMGMSITCCRCHNHPLEKWTQDQYWSMANLFSRVGLKNGDRAGEILVQGQAHGNVPHLRTGIPMPPTPLDGKPLPLSSDKDRRAYFVDWLTSPENPYFAHALVNRVWRNFMGRGLVEAEDDLRQTNPPTNAELFDALARDFVKNKYDVRVLIRTIVLSASYQRSAQPIEGNETDDRFYSRYLIRRLPAEVILDVYSAVTDVPTPFTRLSTAGGDATTAYAGYPLGTRAMELPDSLVVSQFLDAFGRPERSQTCSCERQEDASVAQALHVNNGKTLNDKLRAKNSRIQRWVSEKLDDAEAVRRVYHLALSREPSPAESKRFQTLLAEATADKETTRHEALEDLFWAVLTAPEFLFNH